MRRPGKTDTQTAMVGSEDYQEIARLLRAQAAQSSLPPQQAAKAISLAKYFETLAVDPAGDVMPDRRYG